MAGHDDSGSSEKSPNGLPTFNAENMQNNMKAIYYSRTFMSIIGGVIAGILGFTSLTGFVFYFLVMAITSVGLIAKAGFTIHSYFDSWNQIIFDGILGGLMVHISSCICTPYYYVVKQYHAVVLFLYHFCCPQSVQCPPFAHVVNGFQWTWPNISHPTVSLTHTFLTVFSLSLYLSHPTVSQTCTFSNLNGILSHFTSLPYFKHERSMKMFLLALLPMMVFHMS